MVVVVLYHYGTLPSEFDCFLVSSANSGVALQHTSPKWPEFSFFH
jgi:hypothetical protein